MTVRQAQAQGSGLLKTAGIENGSLDAALLLAHVLSSSRAALAARGPDPLSDEAFAAFRGLLDRRIHGECTAYILGKKEFYALEFLVNPSVLVPRPDTETLVEAALEKLKTKAAPLRALDLCTGSGAVAISLKHEMPQVEVWATDISTAAIDTAQTNASRILSGAPIYFFPGDLYKALIVPNKYRLPRRPFSLIVCNPPYIPTEQIKTLQAEVQKEPTIALDGGPSGLEIIKRVIQGAPDNLLPAGVLLLEADPRQMKDIAALLDKRGFSEIEIYKDLSGQERVIGGVYE